MNINNNQNNECVFIETVAFIMLVIQSILPVMKDKYTIYCLSKLRTDFIAVLGEFGLSNVCIPWTRDDVYSIAELYPDIFKIENDCIYCIGFVNSTHSININNFLNDIPEDKIDIVKNAMKMCTDQHIPHSA